MIKNVLLLAFILGSFTAWGQRFDASQLLALRSAELRHAAAARALQSNPATRQPATDYLQALQAWYGSDFRPEVQGPAAEEFFAAHQAILHQRASLRQPPGPALSAAHDSSTAHLRQLVALLTTARRLPVAAQVNLVKRLATREQVLWTRARGLAPR